MLQCGSLTDEGKVGIEARAHRGLYDGCQRVIDGIGHGARAARPVQRHVAARHHPLRAGRDPARHAAAAQAAGFGEDGQALCRGLDALNRDLHVPTPQAYGIEWDAWEAAMPTMADQALASGSPANNPRVPDHAEIVALYRQVFAGSNG